MTDISIQLQSFLIAANAPALPLHGRAGVSFCKLNYSTIYKSAVQKPKPSEARPRGGNAVLAVGKLWQGLSR